jgi:hypothetical protein
MEKPTQREGMPKKGCSICRVFPRLQRNTNKLKKKRPGFILPEAKQRRSWLKELNPAFPE